MEWPHPFALGEPWRQVLIKRLQLGMLLSFTLIFVVQLLPFGMGWSDNHRESGLMFLVVAYTFFAKANRRLFPHHPSRLVKKALRWGLALGMTLLWSGLTLAAGAGVETALYFLQ